MIALLLAALAQSHSCPGRAVLSSGVSPSGAFACWLWPVDDHSDRNDVRPLAVSHHRIHCRRGTVPVVVTERRVECLRVRSDS